MVFDIKTYLDEQSIGYKTEGKNVSSGWTGTACPFCSDASSHLGISPDGLSFNCWVCGESGHVTKFIRELVDCSWDKAQEILRRLSDEVDVEIQGKTPNASKLKIPHVLDDPLPIQLRYLKKRRFDVDHLKEEYGVKFFPNVGKYNFCLFVPIITNGEIVSFIAADTTGKKELKYDFLSIEQSVIHPKHCLYNIDSIRGKKKALIVEGCTDVWRMGAGTVGTMGTQFTIEQVFILINIGIEKVYVMLDADALDDAYRLADDLGGLIDVEILELDEGDPADLSDNEALKIKRDLL